MCVFKIKQHADVLVCSVKSLLGFLSLFFFCCCSLKVVKSVCLNPSVVIYLQSRDISATILSSLSEKGVCCGFTLAFDLKATKLTWMLKYLTCSPSIHNSCFSQNHGQAGFLGELIQKTKVLAKDGTHLESCQRKLLLVNSLRCFQSIVLAFDLSRIKNQDERKKVQHLDIKRQNLVFILPTGRAPKDHFPLLLHNR